MTPPAVTSQPMTAEHQSSPNKGRALVSFTASGVLWVVILCTVLEPQANFLLSIPWLLFGVDVHEYFNAEGIAYLIPFALIPIPIFLWLGWMMTSRLERGLEEKGLLWWALESCLLGMLVGVFFALNRWLDGDALVLATQPIPVMGLATLGAMASLTIVWKQRR